MSKLDDISIKDIGDRVPMFDLGGKPLTVGALWALENTSRKSRAALFGTTAQHAHTHYLKEFTYIKESTVDTLQKTVDINTSFGTYTFQYVENAEYYIALSSEKFIIGILFNVIGRDFSGFEQYEPDLLI